MQLDMIKSLLDKYDNRHKELMADRDESTEESDEQIILKLIPNIEEELKQKAQKRTSGRLENKDLEQACDSFLSFLKRDHKRLTMELIIIEAFEELINEYKYSLYDNK